MGSVSRWQRYVDAAVRTAGRAAGAAERADRKDLSGSRKAGSPQGPLPDVLERARAALTATPHRQPAEKGRRRSDLRLVPAALTTWAVAVASLWMNPVGLVLLGSGLSVCACAFLAAVWRRKREGGHAPRSLLTTFAVALLLGAAVAAHAADASVHRHEGALADAIHANAPVMAELEVVGVPRRLPMPGSSARSDRWAVTVITRSVTANAEVIKVKAELLVIGGGNWQNVRSGQDVRTTGKLRSADDGRAEAGVLSATSPPVALRPSAPWQDVAGGLRELFRESSRSLPGDASGLLPGMVAGDTNELDEQLGASMKVVGMTHLTAVSGANCTLVLGVLLLAGRSMRLPRAAAAVLALMGLGLFVLTVGPDASVLRAALMGAIGLVSMAGGRTGRGLSFLCLAVIGLLLFDPGLGASFGFVLSVLATLGIVTLGARLVEWTPHQVPRWAAAGFAVPLSAQLFCGPVIVLLQPQFSAYALPANIAAAPLVAPVTILGTAAVPMLPAFPWLGVCLVQVAGVFSNGVAGVARFFAGLPGSSLPWPEGVLGASTMAGLSVLTVLLVWLLLNPAAALSGARAAQKFILLGIVKAERITLWRRPPTGLCRPGSRGSVVRDDHGRLRVHKQNSGRIRTRPR